MSTELEVNEMSVRLPFNMICDECGYKYHKRKLWGKEGVRICPACHSTHVRGLKRQLTRD